MNDIAKFIPNELEDLQNAHQHLNSKSLRLNKNKAKPELIDMDLQSNIPWCEHAFYFSNEEKVVRDPLWHAGAYYVQEASSMFLGFIIKKLQLDTAPLNCLDACAAPGGKTTLLSDALHKDAFILANEIQVNRLNILKENISKWGRENICISHSPTKSFQYCEQFFQLALIDAPCSGSGLFRKELLKPEDWSAQLVNQCSQLQKNIFNDIIPSVAQGAYIIYSTCSFSTAENENIIENAVKQYDLECIDIEIDPNWGIFKSYNEKGTFLGYRFFPHRLDGEGFFISILKKKGAFHFPFFKNQKSNNSILEDYINSEHQILHSGKCGLVAIRPEIEQAIQKLGKKIKIMQVGIAIGELKGKLFIPSHALAMTDLWNKKRIKTIECDYLTAMKYICKEPIFMDKFDKGFYLLTYKNIALGWIKYLGNRINNLYPLDYRIKSKKILDEILK